MCLKRKITNWISYLIISKRISSIRTILPKSGTRSSESKKNIPLTTNSLKSYHNAFKKFFSQAHPSFWLFIQCLKNVQDKVKIKYSKALINIARTSKNSLKLENIYLVTRRYDNYYGLNYLESIYLLYNWKFDWLNLNYFSLHIFL